MNNRKEKFFNDIAMAGPLDDSDRKSLLAAMSVPVVLRFLNSVLQTSDNAIAQLANADLTTPLGVNHAMRLQARAHANSFVVEELLEFITTEPEKELAND